MISFDLRSFYPAVTCAFSLLLTACGGGGGGGGGAPQALATIYSGCVDVQPAAISSNTATEGFNQMNLRRTQIGLALLNRNFNIDNAAQHHSTYQKVNDVITHEQISGKNCFSGAAVPDRLNAANYTLDKTKGYALGEVISASGDLNGANNAEDLITAIYHRYVIFEPVFRDAGAGSFGVSLTGYNFFTVDFGTQGQAAGLGLGKFAVYPYPNQTGITTVFAHKQETPDPVPDQTQTYVGYPVSVHADAINADGTLITPVTVNSFTIKPRGGQVLPVRLLSYATDPGDLVEGRTPPSAASIVPLSPLASATTYDVQFIGTVSGLPVDRIWSFTTR